MAFKLEFRNVNKAFPGVQALKDISFGINEGTVHCLVGENGAGKSTLIKILSGAYHMDSGKILLDGEHIKIDNPHVAQQYKIGFIYQDQNLLDNLNVKENITLGTENTKFGIINKAYDYKVTKEVSEKLSMELDFNRLVSDLSIAEKQLVAIAKTLHLKNEMIVMDESTSSLTFKEQEKLFNIILSLKLQGVTIIYISHNLDEIFEIGDFISVLRDGKHMGTKKVSEIKKGELVEMIVGKKVVKNSFKKSKDIKEDCILSLKNISKRGSLNSISFNLYKGEIIGFYGLVGAGRTELAQVIFGADNFDEGEIILNGKSIRPESPSRSIRRGISLIPEDRRGQGIIGILDVSSNIYLSNPGSISKFGLINGKKIKELSKKFISRLRIKTPSLNQQVKFLSGGNQQKVVIAKILNSNPKILLMDEPTKGIDVGTKSEIFQFMKELAYSGVAIIMFSSELPEVLSMCSRIFVMYRGSIVKELNSKEVSKDKLLHYATGGK